MAWRDQVWCTALRPGCTPQICQISDNFSQARSGERVTSAALCTCTSIIYYVLFQITLVRRDPERGWHYVFQPAQQEQYWRRLQVDIVIDLSACILQTDYNMKTDFLSRHENKYHFMVLTIFVWIWCLNFLFILLGIVFALYFEPNCIIFVKESSKFNHPSSSLSWPGFWWCKLKQTMNNRTQFASFSLYTLATAHQGVGVLWRRLLESTIFHS